MNSIFSKPEEVQQENSYGIKVLFLHGLEGRGSHGNKAKSLAGEWAALCPTLRSQELRMLRESCGGLWSSLNDEEIKEAFKTPYNDAKDAVRYSKPDLIVGSSMGGAILFKLIADGLYNGRAVFCAPAMQNLLPSNAIQEAIVSHEGKFENSVWLLGETDTVVSNTFNIRLAKSLGGSVIISPGDGHRLNKAVESNILNAAVLTALELSEA
jgi:hypothetical protein